MCGAVRFSARNVTSETGACHCKMCQRWAGSTLIAVTVPAADIDWIGLENVGRIQSSDWAERGAINADRAFGTGSPPRGQRKGITRSRLACLTTRTDSNWSARFS